MQPSSWSILRSLLFPFLPGAMWWLRVSAHRMGSELNLALHSQPFPALWPGACEPHTLAPSSGTTAPTRQPRRPGTQRGFGVELVSGL